ncbi:hypothetical protein HCJ02_01830 [Listeria seeligeri]|uniref:hypothetical protein n=1 Tax=Listeria TaxID=1637 RepID=UPI0016264A31|nr:MULTISPECIES: hypothetical protein [Listeria]MBC1532073.1 hypothetical protein [Listeria seeligeri]MBC1827114.1 hypothetical protein [Listeria seeligeri]MBC1840094.1 hypothetical protein [Listeria seeligeri]MBC6141902.1 hypothetical protein [Listeria seeligeri]MBC6302475.1 hypothetical protein [Listeria immobilis]
MGENTNKRKDFWVRVLFLIIIFAPISVLIKYNYSWQIVLIGLVASLSFSFICGINKFQIFKVGKDGIEIIKAVEEAKGVLEDSLLLNLFNANKIGIHEEKVIESIEEAKKYEFIIKNNDITDVDVIGQLEKFKASILLKIFTNIIFGMSEFQHYATDSHLGQEYTDQLRQAWEYGENISIEDLKNLTSKFNECIKEDEKANSIDTNKFHDLVEENVKHYVTNYDYLANK